MKKEQIIGIIPSRMASSRFPGKPLAKICGIPMLGHVYLRSKMSKALNEVYIATCDQEIMDYTKSIGAKAIMTKNTHQRASDRAAEALLEIEKEMGETIDIVVMIQGDEPLIYPEMIDKSIELMLKDDSIQVINLMSPLKSRQEQNDPNQIKVVVDLNDFALYFSREPIPSWKKGVREAPMFKQVCIIPFRRDFLIEFSGLSPTPLEIVESVDMLRVLEHGFKVKMLLTEIESFSVDTIGDLQKVSRLMEKDTLFKQYCKIRR